MIMISIATPHRNAIHLSWSEKDCTRLRMLILLLIVPWCFDATRVYWQGVETAATPVATCLTEMHILHGIQQVAEGNDLYPTIDGLPLTFHYYNPLTYLPTGLAGQWLGLDFDGLLVASRILPLLASLGIAALVGGYIWSRCRDWWLVALAVLMLFFFHSTTLTDFFRNRPETPGLLLTLGGWIVAQLWPRSASSKRLWPRRSPAGCSFVWSVNGGIWRNLPAPASWRAWRWSRRVGSGWATVTFSTRFSR
jgi:hypothetical protein